MRPREHLLVKNLSLAVLPLLQVTRREVVLRFGHVRVISTQFPIVDFKRSLIVAFNFIVFPLKVMKIS